jgi:asparaginyl-tRNA synthetase
MLPPLIKDILASPADSRELTVRGWVRTKRDMKNFVFLEVNDGSAFSGIQCTFDLNAPEGAGPAGPADALSRVSTGASVEVRGRLVPSPAPGQAVELAAEDLRIIGDAPADTYPLQKKRHSLDFLREIAHLRPRTNTFAAVARVRNRLAFAIHQYFQDRGFVYIHTPVITTSDAEGAGAMFQVTTLNLEELAKNGGNRRREGGAAGTPGDKLVDSLRRVHTPAPRGGTEGLDPESNTLQEQHTPSACGGVVDYGKDFFGKPAYLTVSGQLEAETCAAALTRVYTFGPTFRAENSNTVRHLAEFWMVEPEIAFAELADDMALAEDFLKSILGAVLKDNEADLAFFEAHIEKGVTATLRQVVDSPFIHMSYTDAVAELEKAAGSGAAEFEVNPSWGCDLRSEHEKFLTEKIAGGPVIVTGYPREIKAFYMKMNDDGKTVRAMDVLVPRLGEIIGGSQREDRLDTLESRMRALNMNPEHYAWYLDLRRYGTVPHAGFGLGFERLVQYVTGMVNIRDVIPYPRAVGQAEF